MLTTDERTSGLPMVKSAERALRLLELLAPGRPMTFVELQRIAGLPKSSLHSLLDTMSTLGWLTYDRNGAFTLGVRARALGLLGLDESDVIALAEPVLEQLRDRLEETAHLARLDGVDILYLASRYPRHALSVRFELGRRLPAYATALGKATLAELSDEDLASHLPDDFQRFTPKTIPGPDELRDALAVVRRDGFAEDDEESALGLHCFAIAIGHPDLPRIAISTSIPIARLHDVQAPIDALRWAREELLSRLRPVPAA